MCIEKKKGWDGLGDNTLQREFILQDVDNSQEGVENFSSKYICLLFFFAAECYREVNTKRPNVTTSYQHAASTTAEARMVTPLTSF
jgi:hypothetical protein